MVILGPTSLRYGSWPAARSAAAFSRRSAIRRSSLFSGGGSAGRDDMTTHHISSGRLHDPVSRRGGRAIQTAMSSRRIVIGIGFALAIACKKEPAAPPPPGDQPAGAQRSTTTAGDPCAKAHAEGVLAWIEDDYPA